MVCPRDGRSKISYLLGSLTLVKKRKNHIEPGMSFVCIRSLEDAVFEIEDVFSLIFS